ncbi:MAG: hypothetical protein AAB693_01855, partial [Patescibacteria group bacterium]
MLEIKTCQNCQKEFPIEPEDFLFYEKIKVPPPTWCPECRFIRRLSFSNCWNLYRDTCDQCKKEIISTYSQDNNNHIVYCYPCCWGATCDGREYAMDYDPKKP